MSPDVFKKIQDALERARAAVRLVSSLTEGDDMLSGLTEEADDALMEVSLELGKRTPEWTRKYEGEIPEYADMFTAADWKEAVTNGSFNELDGTGHWCRNGKESRDEVFETSPEDATHVSWYNK